MSSTKNRDSSEKTQLVLEGEIYEGRIGLNDLHPTKLTWRDANYWLMIVSLVPVIGLAISTAIFLFNRSRGKLVVTPLFAIVIGMFSTVTFGVLWLIVKAIF